jgi:hypothetical protein
VTKRRRRKHGAFDPDYRRKKWRGTAFSPRRSSLNLTQFSLAVVTLGLIGAYVAPPTAPYMRTTGGLVIGMGIAFVTWILLSVILLIITRRREPAPVPTTVTLNAIERESAARVRLSSPAVTISAEMPKTESGSQWVASPNEYPRPRVYTSTTDKGRALEEEVANIINTLVKDVKATARGGSNDGGVDVVVLRGEKLVGIVQCKNTPGKKITPDEVRAFITVKNQWGVRKAYFVTTGNFSRGVRQIGEDHGIEMIDIDNLNKMRKMANRARLHQHTILMSPQTPNDVHVQRGRDTR